MRAAPRGERDVGALKDAAVTRLADRAEAVEPRLRELTADVADRAGGRLAGLDQARKSWESMRERLDRFQDRTDTPAYAAKRLAGIRDSVRYTIVFADDRYRIGAQATIDDLVERGLRPVAQLRSWDRESGYLGVNTTWYHPETGHTFEIQLHTGSTFAAKSAGHRLYKQLGAGDVSADERATIRTRQLRLFADVPIPPGAHEVGIPEAIPRHRPGRDPVLERPQPRSDPLRSEAEQPERAPEGGQLLHDLDAVALVQRHVVRTPAGLAFYGFDNQDREFAAAVRPVDGYLTLDLHGSPRGFLIEDGFLTAQQFGVALRGLRDAGVFRLAEGVALKLVACDTGRGGEDSAAAILARELAVEVVAPDELVWTALDGDEHVSSPELVDGNFLPRIPPDGRWHRFSPTGREVPLGAAPVAPPPGEPRPAGDPR